jgi:hypothetical protein
MKRIYKESRYERISYNRGRLDEMTLDIQDWRNESTPLINRHDGITFTKKLYFFT